MMNTLLLIAGIFSLFATVGHFAIGYKDFMKPVLEAEIEETPKRVMLSIYHYMSVYMVLTTVVLFMTALDKCMLFAEPLSVVKFIGVSYLGFTFSQLIVAGTAPIKGSILKLFQWVFWILIAVFAFLGS